LIYDYCKGCNQLFSLPVTHFNGSVDKEYYCKADCYCLIEKVNNEKCIFKGKKRKKDNS